MSKNREKVEHLLRTLFDNKFLGINVKRADRWEVDHFHAYVEPSVREAALQALRNAGLTAMTHGLGVIRVPT